MAILDLYVGFRDKGNVENVHNLKIISDNYNKLIQIANKNNIIPTVRLGRTLEEV